jgi:hypothetical protein
MIYGWDFFYEIGEKARDLEEQLSLTERGRVAFADPRLSVTDAAADPHRLTIWIDYAPDEAQERRLAAWKAGDFKPVKGLGTAPFSAPLEGKRAALEDAARAALRAYLRGTERNRPRKPAARSSWWPSPAIGWNRDVGPLQPDSAWWWMS